MKACFRTLAVALAAAPLSSAVVLPNADISVALKSESRQHRTWLDFEPREVTLQERHSHAALGPSVFPDLEEYPSKAIERALSQLDDDVDQAINFVAETFRHPHHPPPDHEHRPTDEFTIWQLLEKSKHGKTFTGLVSDFKPLVDILNSTSNNYTLLIPSEKAFEGIPSDHKKPTGEELERFLRYHIIEGGYDAKQIFFKNTLPTILEEKLLGYEQQRVKVSVGLRGVTVNSYSRVIMPNIRARNGVIHAIDHVLIPPVMVGKGLSLHPTVFSTLLHAYTKTDFIKYIHSVPMEGATVFAPSNRAFARLGPRLNAFLFETERGHKILTAILKYQIVANTTLYSDAAYGKLDGDGDVDATYGSNYHYELKTLYDDKSLGVDIWHLAGLTSMKVNGHISVAYTDGVAKNGVVHVVNSVPMPPCPRNAHGATDHDDLADAVPGSHMSVEELDACFEGLADDDASN